MRVAVAVTPAEVMTVGDVFGDNALPHTLEVSDDTGLKFNGGYAGGGTGDKDSDRSVFDIRLGDLLLYLGVISITSHSPLVWRPIFLVMTISVTSCNQ